MAWLYKQSGSENWWIGYRLNGRQILRSTKTSDRKKAEQEMAKLNSIAHAHKAGSLTEEFIALLTRKESSGLSLRAAVRQWLNECKDLSKRTLPGYRGVTEEFCRYLNATDAAPLLRDIPQETLAAFIREKRAKTSTGTANQNRRILHNFFSYCVDNQMLPHSPVPSSRALKLDRERKGQRRAFTLVELKTIFDKCPSDFWRFMVLGGFYTGQRMGDLICLTWAAVDFERGQLRLKQRKTGRPVTVPLSDNLAALLLDLKRKAGTVKASDAIWPEQCHRYQQRGASPFSGEFYDEVLLPAGLVTARSWPSGWRNGERTARRTASEISFHCLRHTFVSLLKISGASQATAKELAGHPKSANRVLRANRHCRLKHSER
ncbi:MAG: tyrosine-type recombinase/integrase [Verrucomicrobiia bacterium]